MCCALHRLARKRKYESNNMKDKSYQKPVEQPGQKMPVSATFCEPSLAICSTITFWGGGISAPNYLCYSFNHYTKHTDTCSGADDCKLVSISTCTSVYIYIFTYIYTYMCLKIIQKYCFGLSASKFNKKCQLWSVRQWCYRRNACQKPFSGTTEKMSNYIMGWQTLTANSC